MKARNSDHVTLSRQIQKEAQQHAGVALADVRVGATGCEVVCTAGKRSGAVLAESRTLPGLLREMRKFN